MVGVPLTGSGPFFTSAETYTSMEKIGFLLKCNFLDEGDRSPILKTLRTMIRPSAHPVSGFGLPTLW
jgi:hypothetical protein